MVAEKVPGFMVARRELGRRGAILRAGVWLHESASAAMLSQGDR